MTQFDRETQWRYLFNEMQEEERARFENRLLEEEVLFYEIVERENELVDLYARGALEGSLRERFQRSLTALPARRQKVENAKTLRDFIADARIKNKTITIAERSSLFASLFSFSPALQFASIGLIALLALASAFLFFENRRLSTIQDDLAAARAREAELVSQIDNEREATSDLSSDLNAERTRIVELEEEVRKLNGKTRADSPVNSSPSTIATLVLSPIAVRSGGQPPPARLDLPAAATRAAFVINLPAETGDRVNVRLNGEVVADSLRVRSRNGEKSVSVSVPVARIKDQINKLEIVSPTGAVPAAYNFLATRK